MGTKLILYFGHPINTYHTKLEQELLFVIQRNFRNDIIENPSDKCHQDAALAMKEKTGSAVPYFLKHLDGCNGGIFLPFRDGMWDTRMFMEADRLEEAGKPVWKITHEGIITFATNLNARLALSARKTRLRIRYPDGTPKPY
ncbi:MAG: hypothetical protein BMS9Abin13_537 [Patescibacteria group bacterium]|nr:MAG: hypothetical protein BMS9Abin13_537 [Patescibacteria group bacterium]